MARLNGWVREGWADDHWTSNKVLFYCWRALPEEPFHRPATREEAVREIIEALAW